MNLRIAGCILTLYMIAAVIAVAYILFKRSQLLSQLSLKDNISHLESSLGYRKVNTNLASNRYGSWRNQRPRDGTIARIWRGIVDLELDKKYWDQWAPINFSAQYDNKKISQKLKHEMLTDFEYDVDIWSNNGLGEYLWQHILKGEVKLRPDRLYQYGEKIIRKVKYRFKGGNRLNVAFLPDTTEHIVLVLNARDNRTAATAKDWLDGLADLEFIQNAGLVLIGDEMCDNTWLLPYLNSKNRTSLKFIYLVYDSPLVNNVNVFQFPLGVATYRNFPLPAFPDIVVPAYRKYVCNFMGTVYANSSREKLVEILSHIQEKAGRQLCYIKTRQDWKSHETPQSLSDYVSVLKSSDLTLCPVGLNSESYRIYEALSVGSLPVVEDRVVTDSCAETPFRLLKVHKAPVIYIKDWSELAVILEKELQISEDSRRARRADIVSWYERFRQTLSDQFTQTVSSKFFDMK